MKTALILLLSALLSGCAFTHDGYATNANARRIWSADIPIMAQIVASVVAIPTDALLTPVTLTRDVIVKGPKRSSDGYTYASFSVLRTLGDAPLGVAGWAFPFQATLACVVDLATLPVTGVIDVVRCLTRPAQEKKP